MISQQQLKVILQEWEIGLNAPEVLLELPEGPIFHVLVKGHAQALGSWQQARNLVALTGLWPVIVDTREGTTQDLLFGRLQTEAQTAELLQQAREMDTMQMLARHLSSSGDVEDGREAARLSAKVFSSPQLASTIPWISKLMGTWPELVDPENSDPDDFFEPSERLEIPKAKETVSLCFCPVEQSWQVPALLRYGGWNDCPLPAEHSSIHLSWHRRYGAEITCLSGDVIECFVPHPPATQQEARKLALEHFAYCSDIVYQGCDRLEVLAANLLRNRIWYFWWD